jgi:hypothetical protein
MSLKVTVRNSDLSGISWLRMSSERPIGISGLPTFLLVRPLPGDPRKDV